MGEFVTALAGATYRQKEIAKAIGWMTAGPVTVYLEHEPDNPHDSNAVRVDVEKQSGSKRLKIGYLPGHIAASLQPNLDSVRVKGVSVRAPDEVYDFWNLTFTLDDGRQTVFLDADEETPDALVEPPKRAKRQPIGCGGAVLIVGTLFIVGMCVTDDGSSIVTPKPAATSAGPTAADDGKRWVTVLRTSNVRRGPGTNHPVVKTLDEGTRYRCFPPGESATWVKCFEGQYIHRDLVTFE